MPADKLLAESQARPPTASPPLTTPPTGRAREHAEQAAMGFPQFHQGRRQSRPSVRYR